MLTRKQLQKIMVYDPDTGVFVRKSTGKITGTVSVGGYIVLGIGRTTYYAHRLAWLWIHGKDPGLIDHIDRDKTNNRIANLRLADKRMNAVNSVVTWSKSGLRGVYYQSNTKKWRVKAGHLNIGYFDTKEEAYAAYLVAIKANYGVCVEQPSPTATPPRV